MPYQDREHIKKAPTLFKTFVGLASGSLATTVVHPYDLLKTRMQLSNRNLKMVPLAKCIVKNEGGYGSLYKGLTAALSRNVTITAVRLGAFYTLSERYRKKYDKWPSLYDNIVIGIISGLLGAISGTPAEVVQVRMMGDARRVRPGMWSCDRYSSVTDGIKRIIKNDGITGLWRGGLLTLLRSVLVSTTHIYCYKKTHQLQKEYNTSFLPAQRAQYKPHDKHNLQMHIVTSFVSSFFTAAFTLPVDLVKTSSYKENPPMSTIVGYAVVAGALGALVGNPTEVVLVRMMGDGTQGRSCPFFPVRYKSLSDGIKKISLCEGTLGLWRGGALSVLRSTIISSLQIYSYTNTQKSLESEKNLKHKEGEISQPKTGSIMIHLVAAMVSSLYTSILTLPIDMVKTWYQYSTPDPCCTQPYILKSLVKCRSILFLWKGFLPYYLRMCTHTFITFLLLDKLCSSYEIGTINPFSAPVPGPPKKWTPWDD